jgi:Arc/MetJ family transcription regulator
MRSVIELDEKLIAQAQELTGEKHKTVLVNTGLRALIERESAKKLAMLGGTEPQAKAPPRRREQAL